MSSMEGLKNNETELPSTAQIIEEVVEASEKLTFEEEEEEDKKDDLSHGDGDTSKPLDDYIDDLALKDIEVSLTSEEMEGRKNDANHCKEKGNQLFKEKLFDEAREEYTKALRTCPLVYESDRAILFANRAACKMNQDITKDAIEDCTRAIELNPTYLKALHRRAILYEKDDKLDESLEDFKKILELDPANNEARAATMRLPGQIHERNEKLKAEMMGSLKQLGNMILRPLGLSTDNFQLQQDPNSGSYNIQFKK